MHQRGDHGCDEGRGAGVPQALVGYMGGGHAEQLLACIQEKNGAVFGHLPTVVSAHNPHERGYHRRNKFELGLVEVVIRHSALLGGAPRRSGYDNAFFLDPYVALQSKMRNHISRINELPLQGICEIAVKPAKIG
jgi:hypothetical protein